jgi:hypothetical protein
MAGQIEKTRPTPAIQAALPKRARQAFLDRTDQARAPSLATKSGSGRPRRRMS